jgi:hypothetical protein
MGRRRRRNQEKGGGVEDQSEDKKNVCVQEEYGSNRVVSQTFY